MGILKKTSAALMLLTLSMLLQSCLGISSEVHIKEGGSGTIALEYRLSKMLESLGKLDGNEAWLPLPVGREDIERTVSRIEGLSLSSYSTSRTDMDILVTVELAFTNMEALSVFLDRTGRSATISEEKGKTIIKLKLYEGASPLDADLDTLVKTVFADYGLDLRFTTPTEPSISIVEAGAPGTVGSSGNTATYSIPIYEVLSYQKELGIDVSWTSP